MLEKGEPIPLSQDKLLSSLQQRFRVFTGPLSCMWIAVETEKELLEENEENLVDTHPLTLITYSLY